tara:strand:- start:484 stop:990 length:507 start_codon:yes stop_codon:yes gene_type:complete
MVKLNRKFIKRFSLDKSGFGLSETILSFLLLSFITTYALYFVSLRQSTLYKANLNNAVNDEIRRDIEKLKSELWYQHFNAPTTGRSASYSTEDIRYIRYCRDVINTFNELPSWSIEYGIRALIRTLIQVKKEIRFFPVEMFELKERLLPKDPSKILAMIQVLIRVSLQ